GRFLGILNVTAADRAQRLRPSAALLELLQGVAAQAAIALENGRLVDGMAHQARHDALTDLPNRLLFTERAEDALAATRRTGAGEAFAAPFTVAGRSLAVSVSVGVATFPHDAGALESLLSTADAAMYAAKRRSRARAAA